MSLAPKKVYKFNKENVDYLFNMDRREKAIYSIKRSIDRELGNIDFTNLQNRKIIIGFSVLVTIVNISYPVFAAGTGIEWADNIGYTFLHYAQAVGMWACVIKAVLTLIQAVAQDTVNMCWKNIIGYAIAGLAIYKVPNIFFTLK